MGVLFTVHTHGLHKKFNNNYYAYLECTRVGIQYRYVMKPGLHITLTMSLHDHHEHIGSTVKALWTHMHPVLVGVGREIT